MNASLTIDAAAMPMTQVTLRRSVDSAELVAQIYGSHDLTLGAAVVGVIDGITIVGVIADYSSTGMSTSITVAVEPEIGVGIYAPKHVHVLSSGMVRGDLDFGILPGDTHKGMVVKNVTHTLGIESPAFTEVRF